MLYEVITDVSWLWTLLHHQAVITKDGYLKRPALTEDGLTPAEDAFEVKAGTRFTEALFQKLWDFHNEWTSEFFAELDRLGNPGRFDQAKAPVIMEILKRRITSYNVCYTKLLRNLSVIHTI